VELSGLDQLESGKRMKITDCGNKNNCGKTSDSLSCPSPSPTQEHFMSLTSEFAGISLEEQAQDSMEIVQLNDPKEGSVIHDVTVSK